MEIMVLKTFINSVLKATFVPHRVLLNGHGLYLSAPKGFLICASYLVPTWAVNIGGLVLGKTGQKWAPCN